MSNINHGVGMNIIDLSSPSQELSCEEAAAIQGGQVDVTLYTGTNFNGRRLNVNTGIRNLSQVGGGFNDAISSIRVRSGAWIFCTNPNYQGNCTLLGEGNYPSVSNAGIRNNSLTSLRGVS